MDYEKLNILLNEVLTGAYDHEFIPVLESVHCMSRPRVYAVLNAIVSCMDQGETYVEVGTYQGGSLISALLNNQARAIGIDSFGEFTQTNSLERTKGNLEQFGVANRVDLRNSDFKAFFAALPRDFKIQVYYYDAEHGFEPQLAGMEAAWDFLAPGGIILVDDFTYPEVARAVNQFIVNHINAIKPLFIIDPIESTDPIWWNGCVVLRKV